MEIALKKLKDLKVGDKLTKKDIVYIKRVVKNIKKDKVKHYKTNLYSGKDIY